VEFLSLFSINAYDLYDYNLPLFYKDNCGRVEVERAFSLAKEKYGLGLIRTRLKETTQSAIALSILSLNLGRFWCAFLQFMFVLFFDDAFLVRCEKMTFVQ
jgi:hypothetical protein